MVVAVVCRNPALIQSCPHSAIGLPRDPPVTKGNSPLTLERTGERCIPGETSPIIFAEHIHRYLFALGLVGDRVVLDVGSGEGYGGALLAQRARQVSGIDIDEAA